MQSKPNEISTKRSDLYYINLLKNGDENGLAHFYKRLYPAFSYRALRGVKDEVAATSIAQEAFLKLWLVRTNMHSIDEIILFLRQQTKKAVFDFYRKSSSRFHRGLMRLDDIENYQEFLTVDNQEELDIEDLLCDETLDAEDTKNLKTITKVISTLEQNQQLFIKLCLRYSFSYDRIAYHLGGISSYEVARKVERTIACLKDIIVNANKLDAPIQTKKIMFEGELSNEQLTILNMRYELNYSFQEIADALGLDTPKVQRVFVEAYSTIKKTKTTTKNSNIWPEKTKLF